jgi:nitrate reductase assembly molybdenum cofactor insertion protein NarJ
MNISETRPNYFKLFSLIFSYPSQEVLEEIKQMTENYPELASGLKSAIEKLVNVKIDELQTEYTRLFVSSHPTLLCPPYESYYREGIVYGNASVEVREIYESHGLDYVFEGEPPDHISVELDFLAITGDKKFVDRLKEWVFDFTRRVKENSDIYGIFAEELEKYLDSL